MSASGFDPAEYDAAYPDGVEHTYWNLARNRLIHATLGRGEPGLVLDVGCGRGIVVDYLRRHGIDCWGCETADPRPLSADVAPYILTRTKLDALDPAFAANVHTVLLLDVLEHVAEPEAMLAACRARLPSARRIIITLPARQELWTNFDDHYGHLRRYDLDSARTLIASLAPVGVELGYFFHALYPAIRAVALAGRPRPVTVTAPTTPFGRAAHRALAAGLVLDARLLPRWLPGSSILADVTL